MKTKCLILFAALLLPLAARAQPTTVTTGFISGSPVIYNATGVLTSGTVVITGTADVSFVSDGHVTLSAGFKVAVGARFRAVTGTDVDGDGMPNAWEAANGLNILVNDAAGDADVDGIPNRIEYLLGTNPQVKAQNDTANPSSTQLKIQKPF